MSRRRITRGKKLLLAAFGGLLAILAMELACSLLGLFPPDPRVVGASSDREHKNFVADPALGWRMRPGARFVWKTEGEPYPFLASEDGFRIDDRDDASSGAATNGAAASDAPRAVFVGDSFTFGTGVAFADSFAARTAAALGTRVENRGMPGFGVDQMWITVDQVVLPVPAPTIAAAGPASPAPPALLVVAVVRDDFERSLHAFRVQEGFAKPAFELVDGRLRRRQADDDGGLVGFLERRSHLWTAWKGVQRRLSERFATFDWWELNAACLESIAARAHERDVPLVFVHVPSHQDWRRLAPLGALASAREPPVPVLDLADVRPTPPEGAYYERDGHLRPAGHAWLAEELTALVRRRWPEFPRRTR